MTHQKAQRAEIRTRRKHIRPQLKRLEKENGKLRNEIRKLQLVRWIANDTALTYLYQIRRQYEQNEQAIAKLYDDAQYQKRSLNDKRFDFALSLAFPAMLFATLLILLF